GRPPAGGDSRVEASGDVERVGIGASDRIAVAQVADDVVRRPVGAPRRRSPVLGTESSQDRGEPLPLRGPYVEQVLRIDVARPLGPQEQPAGRDLLWYWAAVNHRSPRFW